MPKKLLPPPVSVDWDAVPWRDIRPMHPELSIQIIIDRLPTLVWNDITLEGSDLSQADIDSLIDGGDPLNPEVTELDADKARGLIEAYRALILLLQSGYYDLEKDTVNQLASYISKAEVLDPGRFRCDSNIGGGGHVRLTSGEEVSGIDRSIMSESYDQLIDSCLPALDPRQAALYYYATCVRWQLWFDGNKRTARLAMLGQLVESACEPLSVPAEKRVEFHNALDVLFSTGDATSLCRLIAQSPVPLPWMS